MKVEGILFDFDGTLGNTTKLILTSFHETMKHFGFAPVEDKDIIATFGLPLRQGLEVLMPGLSEEDAIEYYRTHNVGNHDELIESFPYVEEGLAALKQRGYKLAVVTSKKKELAHRGLEILNLDKYFTHVITSDDCTKHKPEAEPMEKGAEALGLDPKNCLCVGDSPYDLLSGNAAGCTSVLVNWTPYTDEQVLALVKPEYRIDKLTDLVPLIESLS